MSQYINMSIPKPWQQAVLAFLVGIVLMLLGLTMPDAPLFAWMVSGALLLLFVVFNNGLAIFSDNFFIYAQRSVFSFVGLLVAFGFLAWLFSGKSLDEAYPYRTIYLIMVLAHISLLAICFLIRSVADFLRERDERMHGR